jgi:protein disulfide-isomerase A1
VSDHDGWTRCRWRLTVLFLRVCARSLVKVDATIHSALGEQHEVRGYPTIKFFRNGAPTEYNGGRTADEIVNWLAKRTGPAFSTLTTAAEVEAFIADNDVAVIAAITEGSDAADTFKAVALAIDDVPFAAVNDKALLADATGDSSIVLFKKFDEGKVVFDGDAADEQAVSAFVKQNMLPLIVEFTQQSASKIFGGDIKVHCLLFVADAETTLLNDYREIARSLRGQMLFIWMDVNKEDSKRVLEFFNINEAQVPDVRIVKLGRKMEKFSPPSSPVDAQSLSSFIEGFVSGKVDRTFSSEEPVPYSGKGVRVLVGKDHDSIVQDPSLNVFVEYYAPWCGHCKQLAPIWDELAADFDNVDNVVIAKMDSTANEVAGVDIQGFPTLKFYPAGANKVAIDYEQDRDLKAFKSFILANSNGVDAQNVREEL